MSSLTNASKLSNRQPTSETNWLIRAEYDLRTYLMLNTPKEQETACLFVSVCL